MQNNKIGAKVIKSTKRRNDFVQDVIQKSDQVTNVTDGQRNLTEWITPPFNQLGFRNLIDNSAILPQCIAAYKTNIVGFGIGVRYKENIDETPEMAAEWDKATAIIETLNTDKDIKEVFEDVIECRESCGIAYLEVIRNAASEVIQVDFVREPETITKTVEEDEAQDCELYVNGLEVTRKKRFHRYKQMKDGKTVYFKEFGDKRVMDLVTGEYTEESIELSRQANELLEFKIGNTDYGMPRWFGQILNVSGSRKAEELNYNYFINGRHTPLAIIVEGGTLSDDSFNKLQEYVNGIKGENGQHAFLVLEVEQNDEGSTSLDDSKKTSVELKDLSPMLQQDALFLEYLEKNRRNVQSSFRLPDIYVGYSSDYNRATVQSAIEITEQQVFIPERISLAWIINNKLLSEYQFKYVEAYFKSPEITNYEDLARILGTVNQAGGLTPNKAKELLFKALGEESENYEDEWGDIPIVLSNQVKTEQTEQEQSEVEDNSETESTEAEEYRQQLEQEMENAVNKAVKNHDDDIVPILKSVRNMLSEMGVDNSSEKDIIKEWDESLHLRDENGRFGDSGSSDLPVDSDGNSYSRPAINLPKKEYGKVMHSINEVYDTKYKGKRIGSINIATKSGYSKYGFEIHDYNEYNIFEKKVSSGIKKMEKELKNTETEKIKKELKQLLEGIPDTYDDFVVGIYDFCYTDKERQMVIDYIKSNPNATTSDVIEYHYDEIEKYQDE